MMSKSGFALPTVLIASVVMMMVLLSGLTALASTRTAQMKAYESRVVRTASEAGVVMAQACLAKNNGTPLWTNSKPLKPNTDCSGNDTVTCPSTDADARSANAMCFVLSRDAYRTSFEVTFTSFDGKVTSLNSKGILRTIRSTSGLTYSMTSNEAKTFTTSSSSNISYSDDFASSGALGNVKTGSPTIAYQFLNSSSSNWTRNSGAYATSTMAAASNPMALAPTGVANASITMGVRSTGNAIYFRVTDASNWLRARLNYVQTYQNSGYYQTVNYYRHEETISTYAGNNCSGMFGYSDPGATYVDTSSANPATYCSGTERHDFYTSFDHSEQQYVDTSGYVYTYYIVLDKSVGGAITQFNSTNVGTTMPAFIKVIASGSSIATYYGSTSSTTSSGASINDTTNQAATLHGVGYASSQYASSTGIKSLSITNAP